MELIYLFALFLGVVGLPVVDKGEVAMKVFFGCHGNLIWLLWTNL